MRDGGGGRTWVSRMRYLARFVGAKRAALDKVLGLVHRHQLVIRAGARGPRFLSVCMSVRLRAYVEMCRDITTCM